MKNTKNSRMKELLRMSRKVAATDATVIITGESGTGKEILAQFIHSESQRVDYPFVVVNCGAIPKDIVESELFGHEKGAFTGAQHQKPGYFEMADGGTLFLDELVELPMEMQVKLLRAVETNIFRRVGGQNEIEGDLRYLAATNKDIQTQIELQEFREDLFYRLGVIELHIPPLRERKEDIPQLITRFLNLYTRKYGLPEKKITEEVGELLLTYNWPGNVRELRNLIEGLVILSPEGDIHASYLPERFRVHKHMPHGNKNGYPVIEIPLGSTMEDAQHMIIQSTLQSVEHNISEASRILGVSRKTMHNKIKEYKALEDSQRAEVSR